MYRHRGTDGDFDETRLHRFIGAVAAVIVWMCFASVGWCWVQFIERLIELPGVAGAILEWSNELLSPDSIARRAMTRTMRG